MNYSNHLINSVAQDIDMGQTCYVNADTLEVAVMMDFEQLELMGNDELIDEEKQRYQTISQWEHYIKIEPLKSYEYFEIMKSFVDGLPPGNERTELVEALNNRKPFRGFNDIIHNSNVRGDWFKHKQQRLEDYVKYILENEKGSKLTFDDLYEDS
jgi:hypothetical protein